MARFSKLDPMRPQENNYIEVLLEMSQHDLRERDIKDVSDVKNACDNVTKAIPFNKKTDPIRFYKHEMKREDAFKHPVFGNNYRMFGLEKPFDVNELPWR